VTPTLENLDMASLRQLALTAWRRAEALEYQAKAEEQRARAEEQRAAKLEAEVEALTKSKAESDARAEALDAQVAVLLRRISQLTRALADAKDRDAQLELELELGRLRERLGAANRELFGSKSERRGRQEEAPEEGEAGPEPKGPTKKEKPKKKGHGPTRHDRLEVKEELHLLDEADCICPTCGDDLRVMGGQFEESELVSRVEVKYIIKLHKRQKYRCGECGHIDTALGPLRLIPGGRYDISFVVQVALDKYLDNIPLERQVARMARHGLTVTSQTLWDQLFALYLILLPTFLAIKDHVLRQPILFADETSWRIMDKGGPRRSARWWLWTLASTVGVYYEIFPTRGSAAARELLGSYAGLLMADGYSVYSSLEKALERKGGRQLDLESGRAEVLPNFTLAGCWMHARRPLYQAEKSAPEVGHALDLVARLYSIEARARELAGDDPEALLEHRRRLRATESRPIIEELALWRDAQRPLPGTKYAKGVTYLRNQWTALTGFLDNPLIPLDNGEAERQLRGPVVGRKVYGGCQSERGTRVAALFFTLLRSAVKVGLNPVEYLQVLTERCLQNPGYVLLPQDYAAELASEPPA
jgi:transposase